MFIESGDVCGCPACPGTAAINKVDEARYEQDYNAARAQCPDKGGVCPAICECAAVVCNSGTCGVSTGTPVCKPGSGLDAGAE
jgi:hypothetical protein